MEKNTVNLSVKDYNELRDFNEAIRESRAVHVYLNWDNEFSSTLYTESEAVDKIAKVNIELKAAMRKLQNPDIEKSIEEVRRMSLWTFRKWKRTR